MTEKRHPAAEPGPRGRVPIVRRGDGKLVGIIARKDLLQVRARMLAQEQERERRPQLRSAARGRARRAG